MGNGQAMYAVAQNAGGAQFPHRPSEEFLERLIADLSSAERVTDEATRTARLESIIFQLRNHLAALRLEADPAFAKRCAEVWEQVQSGSLRPGITLDEFDRRYADDLSQPSRG